MKKFFSFLMVAVLLCGAVQAKTWRINNDPEAKADFLSIDEAMESLEVYAGDVLYLDPGCRLPSQTVSKGVTVIGTGYNLAEAEEAMVAGITVSAENTKLTGINVTGQIKLSSNYVTIERCKATSIWLSSGGKNIEITGCYVLGGVSGFNTSSLLRFSTLRNSIILGKVNLIENSTISNNIIIYDSGTKTGSNDYDYLLYNIYTSTITNNIIINTTTHTTQADNVVTNWSHMTIHNTTVSDGNTITNNVLSTDAAHAWADFPNNKFIGAKVEDIFVNEGNQEEKYKLKEGSAALGYGINGVDCGVFDGQYPYVLSGRPRFVPYIYDAQIPNTPTDGKLNITLKIKSQNE